MKAATIKDIAQVLDIHHSTVSRALKDHPDVAPKTQKLVVETAKKLNYTPNAAATALRSGTVKGTLVSLPLHATTTYPALLQAVAEYSTGDTTVVLGHGQYPGMHSKRLVVTLADGHAATLAVAAATHSKTVVVSVDLQKQMAAAVDSLANAGKRHLSLLATSILADTQERCFNAILLDRFLPVRSLNILRSTQGKGVGDALSRVFSGFEPPDGIVISTAPAAIEAAALFEKQNIEVSIVCLDESPRTADLPLGIVWLGYDLRHSIGHAFDWLENSRDSEPNHWIDADFG